MLRKLKHHTGCRNTTSKKEKCRAFGVWLSCRSRQVCGVFEFGWASETCPRDRVGTLLKTISFEPKLSHHVQCQTTLSDRGLGQGYHSLEPFASKWREERIQGRRFGLDTEIRVRLCLRLSQSFLLEHRRSNTDTPDQRIQVEVCNVSSGSRSNIRHVIFDCNS